MYEICSSTIQHPYYIDIASNRSMLILLVQKTFYGSSCLYQPASPHSCCQTNNWTFKRDAEVNPEWTQSNRFLALGAMGLNRPHVLFEGRPWRGTHMFHRSKDPKEAEKGHHVPPPSIIHFAIVCPSPKAASTNSTLWPRTPGAQDHSWDSTSSRWRGLYEYKLQIDRSS